MPKIFFCYRRQDSSHQAGRLFDHLSTHFGADHLFKDVDSMPLGRDFRRVLAEQVSKCDVVLVLIGDEWLSAASPEGGRRLDDPADFVRIEVETALSREIPVIPLLVGSAPLPAAESLPPSLRGLAFRHGIPIRPDPDFRQDVRRLVDGIIEQTTRPGRGPTPAKPRADGRPARVGHAWGIAGLCSLSLVVASCVRNYLSYGNGFMVFCIWADALLLIPASALFLCRWATLRLAVRGFLDFLLCWVGTAFLAGILMYAVVSVMYQIMASHHEKRYMVVTSAISTAFPVGLLLGGVVGFAGAIAGRSRPAGEGKPVADEAPRRDEYFS